MYCEQVPTDLLRVTASPGAWTQHLRASELKCRTQDIYGQVLLKYGHPQMLRFVGTAVQPAVAVPTQYTGNLIWT